MSTRTLPRLKWPYLGYCWAEHPRTYVHCTEPPGHNSRHWHPYSRTSW